jgi:7-carboxy-7-deazaguanine synthase
VTGGEPLLQPGAFGLVRLLTAGGVTVVVETNGTVDFSDLPPEAVCIMDVKCPGSGEEGHTLRSNLEALRSADEVKFVLCDRADFDWAAQFVRRYKLAERCAVLMSPARGFLEGRDLAAWILESGLHARLQLQLHRILWPEIERGV